MLTYILIYAALLLINFLIKDRKIRYKSYLAIIIFSFLFSGFRYEVGCDWTSYLGHFQLQFNSTVEEALARRDPLWWLIIEGIIRLELPYPWLNVVTSAIFFIGMHALARRQPDPLGFFILLYPVLIINMPMSAIRQAAAIGILAFAFLAFFQQKLLRFVLFVLLAAGVHASALVFLLLALLVRGDFSRYRLALGVMLALPGAYFLMQTDVAELARARYIGTDIEAKGALARNSLLFITAVFFHLMLKAPWKRLYPREYKLMLLSSLAMLMLVPMTFVSTVIADRMGYFFIPIQAMMLARIPFLSLGRRGRLLAAAPHIAFFFVFVVWASASWHFQECYIPYRFWRDWKIGPA